MAALESAMPKGTSGGRLGPAVVSYDAAVVPSPTLPSVDVIKCYVPKPVLPQLAPLVAACMEGDVGSVRALWKPSLVDIIRRLGRDDTGSPLLTATHHLRVAVVQFLLEQGLSPRQRGTVHPYTGDSMTVSETQGINPLELINKMSFMHPRKSKRRDAVIAVQELLKEADAKEQATLALYRQYSTQVGGASPSPKATHSESPMPFEAGSHTYNHSGGGGGVFTTPGAATSVGNGIGSGSPPHDSWAGSDGISLTRTRATIQTAMLDATTTPASEGRHITHSTTATTTTTGGSGNPSGVSGVVPGRGGDGSGTPVSAAIGGSIRPTARPVAAGGNKDMGKDTAPYAPIPFPGLSSAPATAKKVRRQAPTGGAAVVHPEESAFNAVVPSSKRPRLNGDTFGAVSTGSSVKATATTTAAPKCQLVSRALPRAHPADSEGEDSDLEETYLSPREGGGGGVCDATATALSHALASGDAVERYLAEDALNAVHAYLPKCIGWVTEQGGPSTTTTTTSTASGGGGRSSSGSSSTTPRPTSNCTLLLVGAPESFELPGDIDIFPAYPSPTQSPPTLPGASPTAHLTATNTACASVSGAGVTRVASPQPPRRVALSVQKFVSLQSLTNACADAAAEGKLLAALTQATVRTPTRRASTSAATATATAAGGASASAEGGGGGDSLGYAYSYGYGQSVRRSVMSSLAFGKHIQLHQQHTTGGSAPHVSLGVVAAPYPFALPPPTASPSAALGISSHLACYTDIAGQPELTQLAQQVASAEARTHLTAAATRTRNSGGSGSGGDVLSGLISAPASPAALAAARELLQSKGGSGVVSSGEECGLSDEMMDMAPYAVRAPRAAPKWTHFSAAAPVGVALMFLSATTSIPSTELFLNTAIDAHKSEAWAAGGLGRLLVSQRIAVQPEGPRGPRLRRRLYDIVVSNTLVQRSRRRFEAIGHSLRALMGSLVCGPHVSVMLVMARPAVSSEAYPTESIFPHEYLVAGPEPGTYMDVAMPNGTKRRREEGGLLLSEEAEHSMLQATTNDIWAATLSSVLKRLNSSPNSAAITSAVGTQYAVHHIHVELVAPSPTTTRVIAAELGPEGQLPREYVVVYLHLSALE